ncbi:hypothetical protein K435DRAFT_871288 [Dendrothele bispora CBS 962.96]|uniref:Uncharacterized protein n=1 Tax=Dendrothele bispora (strain CBS 962.96) TaxID=1314807 RepID=A0A4S8L4W9_DENBC|nr:hypothetical protein K435DRAFT_871288 [Dendrothele bispora CBS 962.96]
MPSSIVQLDHAEEDEKDEDVGVSALSARTWDLEIPTNVWVRVCTRRTSFNATSYSEASSANGFRVLPISSWSSFSPDNAQAELNGNWIAVNTTEVRLWSLPWDRKFVVDVIGGMSNEGCKDVKVPHWPGQQDAFGVGSSQNNQDVHKGAMEGKRKKRPTQLGRVTCDSRNIRAG